MQREGAGLTQPAAHVEGAKMQKIMVQCDTLVRGQVQKSEKHLWF